MSVLHAFPRFQTRKSQWLTRFPCRSRVEQDKVIELAEVDQHATSHDTHSRMEWAAESTLVYSIKKQKVPTHAKPNQGIFVAPYST